MGGDPVRTSFFNALTITFPQGEHFFIDSVKPFRNDAPPALRSEIADFIKQEALHTREHVAFNKQVEDRGYDTTAQYALVERELGKFRKRSRFRQLGLTISLEHFTALFARELLENEEHLRGTPASVRQMWRWHALEEVEHKSVAFDTFLFATKHWSRPRRFLFRSIAMLEASYHFARIVWFNMSKFYDADGIESRGRLKRSLSHLFGKGGVLRALIKGWLSWFKPNFHPSQHEDSDLIDPVRIEFSNMAAK
nr:metal-dependent hydrolase [Hyphomonas sp. Mor2]